MTLKSFDHLRFLSAPVASGDVEGLRARPTLCVEVFYVHAAAAKVTRNDAVARIYCLGRWLRLPLKAHKNKAF